MTVQRNILLHWLKTFLGLALYVKYTPSLPFTIGEINRQRQGCGKPLDEHLTAILESRKDLPDACVMALQSFLAEDKGGARKTFCHRSQRH
ncbi:hypothetical protein PCI56_04475 [Plesiomonas shigelloides subsp. oncorhynchi]|nr:hypothetical protein [Plesiomonas shigelloides]